MGGDFSTIDGLSVDGVARFNGYVWSKLDIDLPGTVDTLAIIPSQSDPIIPQKYDLWLGFDASGTATYAGLESVSNGGTAPAFPVIYFNRSGGTGATIQTLKNERTGKELLFNYSLLDGETLTIDLGATEKLITSSTGLPAQSAVLNNSMLGDWSLLTGNNDITSFVSEDGSPTIVGWMIWKDKFKSQN